MTTNTAGGAAAAITPAGTEQLGERMMVGILGRARQGKGLLAAKLAYEAHVAGVRVFHLGNLAFGEVLDIQQLADQDPRELANCLVVLDEVKQLLPSYGQSSAYGQLVSSNLIQAGHQGLSVLWTTISQRSLAPALYELTDYVYFVAGAHEPWTTDEQIASGEVDPDDDNRCPAWKPTGRYRRFHAEPAGMLTSCLDVPEKRAVRYKVVSQAGSSFGFGKWRRFGQLHCAHRMYGLTHTTHKIDASGRMMLTADRIRAFAKHENFQVVRQVAMHLAENGYGKLGLGDIADAMRQATGGELDISNDELRTHLRHAGVHRRRGGGANYNLATWAEANRQRRG